MPYQPPKILSDVLESIQVERNRGGCHVGFSEYIREVTAKEVGEEHSKIIAKRDKEQRKYLDRP